MLFWGRELARLLLKKRAGKTSAQTGTSKEACRFVRGKRVDSLTIQKSTMKFNRDLHANKIRTMAHEKKQFFKFIVVVEAGSSQNTRRLLWD
jgi:hypothetical protein